MELWRHLHPSVLVSHRPNLLSMLLHADAASVGRLEPRIADHAAGTRLFERADSLDEALEAPALNSVSQSKLCAAISVSCVVSDPDAAAATGAERLDEAGAAW